MKEQWRLLILCLTILMISIFSYKYFYKSEKFIFNYGNEKFFIDQDTFGIIKDSKNKILKKDKISLFSMQNHIFFNFYDFKLLKVNKDNFEVKAEFDLIKIRPLGIVFKNLKNEKILFSTNEKIYFMDKNLNVLNSPLDSIYKYKIVNKKNIKGDWSYEILNDSLIKLNFTNKENINFSKLSKF